MASFFVCMLWIATILRHALGMSIERRPHRRYPQKLMQRSDQDGFIHDGSTSERTVVILYNKPRGLLTSHVSDDLILPAPAETSMQKPRGTVYDDVQSMEGFVPAENLSISSSFSFEKATGIRSKLHSIGRLDADTSGLLLFTNDGALVHHVTNPNASTHGGNSRVITKTYEAVITGIHDEASLQSLRSGVDLGPKYGGVTKPVHDLQVLDHPNHKSTMVSLTISEGRNRQVRRMFHAINSGVMKLKRTRIGGFLTLVGLSDGQWRLLSDTEIEDCLHWKPRTLSAPASTNPARNTRNPSPTSKRRSRRRHNHSKGKRKR